jgi:hypothetical protein
MVHIKTSYASLLTNCRRRCRQKTLGGFQAPSIPMGFLTNESRAFLIQGVGYGLSIGDARTFETEEFVVRRNI